MILVFGGTTEGRIAAKVCDDAGKSFFYSTKGEAQDVALHNGIRLSGGMTTSEMVSFCQQHAIRCIINAAHPFAINLHQAIMECANECHLPVIRLQRNFSERREGIVYCSDFNDAIMKMEQAQIRRLLALSGANTICKLKPFWTRHDTFFRILKREESIRKAEENNFDTKRLVFYNEQNTLPSKEEEGALMQSIGCDAIITKESGDSGGFEAKVDAALERGINVFVVCHPVLPTQWIYTCGKYSLRRAIEREVPDFFPLKTGLTTGACATAATKAALLSLLCDDTNEDIYFALPDGERLSVPVEHIDKATAVVTKDHNDDPDVTKGCRIFSHVEIRGRNDDEPQLIRFLKGNGVGTVTLPGLGIPVGEPAVNPTPRRMITDEIKQITNCSVDVTISVENGEALAQKTFNPRVGVLGGISILGTSGIVHPLSNEAFIKSIRRELEVARAIGYHEVGLVAGMKSERALKEERKEKGLPGIRCVHYGNFIGEALKAAHELLFSSVTLSIMIGKAVKLAEGNLDTHSHKVTMNKEFLADVAKELGLEPTPIYKITMARELWDFMPQPFFDKITSLCYGICRKAFPEGELNIKLICDKRA